MPDGWRLSGMRDKAKGEERKYLTVRISWNRRLKERFDVAQHVYDVSRGRLGRTVAARRVNLR